jgi:hypothetical protein
LQQSIDVSNWNVAGVSRLVYLHVLRDNAMDPRKDLLSLSLPTWHGVRLIV